MNVPDILALLWRFLSLIAGSRSLFLLWHSSLTLSTWPRGSTGRDGCSSLCSRSHAFCTLSQYLCLIFGFIMEVPLPYRRLQEPLPPLALESDFVYPGLEEVQGETAVAPSAAGRMPSAHCPNTYVWFLALLWRFLSLIAGSRSLFLLWHSSLTLSTWPRETAVAPSAAGCMPSADCPNTYVWFLALLWRFLSLIAGSRSLFLLWHSSLTLSIWPRETAVAPSAAGRMPSADCPNTYVWFLALLWRFLSLIAGSRSLFLLWHSSLTLSTWPRGNPGRDGCSSLCSRSHAFCTLSQYLCLGFSFIMEVPLPYRRLQEPLPPLALESDFVHLA